MSVIFLFSGSYCHGEEIAQRINDILGYKQVDDETLIAEASKRFHIDEAKLARALSGKASIFNKFTHERERSLAALRLVLADLLSNDNLLLFGFAGHMVPRDISHILKVCAIADIKYRAGLAAQIERLSEKDALKKVHKEDEGQLLLVEHLFNQRDPWNPSLYDIVIPTDKNSVDAATTLVLENIQKDILKVTRQSEQAAKDFLLASEVNLMLAREGHDVTASADDGHITVTINKNVLRLSALQQELKRLAGAVPGVKQVDTKVGPGYYQSDIYRKYEFELPVPSKVLLVDDEREFVQTLSERLQMRDMPAAVVYGGEEALSVVDEEEPEVMVLDLKMPGIDGIEVLRRVKKEHPDVEVIVLTGHGSKDVEKLCMELGACAYLEKPVDIDTLTQTMKTAYERSRSKKREGSN
jgi:two-component system, OmpR family, response regulator CpxR